MSNPDQKAELETNTTIFQVIVTTEATVSATMNIVASSPEEANRLALENAKSAVWTLDEDSIHCREAYLPDEDSTEPLLQPAQD